MYQNLTQDDIDTISAFFNYVDTDSDGHISKSEIENAMAVDLDNDGVISSDEKVAAGVQWFQTHFQLQDLNHDSMLTLDELLKYNDLYKDNPNA